MRRRRQLSLSILFSLFLLRAIAEPAETLHTGVEQNLDKHNLLGFVNFGSLAHYSRCNSSVVLPEGLPGSNPQTVTEHKGLFPLDLEDWVTLSIASLSILLASGSGIGGGGVFVPLLLLVTGFTTSKAVAISNLIITGGAVANFICNVTRRHPGLPGPLIDWDLILVMEPTTILGALLGGYLNKLLPSWLTGLLMALLLSVMSLKLWNKGREISRKEVQQKDVVGRIMIRCTDSSPHLADQLRPLLASNMTETDSVKMMLTDEATDDESLESDGDSSEDEAGSDHPAVVDVVDTPAGRPEAEVEYDSIVRNESRQIPYEKLGILVLITGCVLASDSIKSLVPCGSLKYWLVVLGVVPVAVGCMLVTRRTLLHKIAVKKAAGHARETSNVNWTPNTTVVYPMICTLAGVIAGLFGVGGGIVKGPLMLELGVLPEVVAATSATMILFTAGTASILYIQFGTLDGVWDYAATLTLTGFVGTLVGQWLTRRLLRVFGRSVIVFMMFSVLALSSLAMYYESVRNLMALHQHPQLIWQWGHICRQTTTT